MINYGRQNIDQGDIDAVVDVLNSDYLTQGSKIDEFEKNFSKYVGSEYATAVSSATAALHIACLALDLKPGDTVWTSPNSFVASSNCAIYCGANVDFVDISKDDFNLCLNTLEKKLIKAKDKGMLPKIIIPVHFAGLSCDMSSLHKLSLKYNFKIIEDASHATGGDYNKKKIGSCEFSDITVFSFHPVKIITTGEGGMLSTNNKALDRSLKLLRTHGITREKSDFIDSANTHNAWYYEQIYLGFNYRITDIQAALGLSQLYRIEKFLEQRRLIASKYQKDLKNLPISFQSQSMNAQSSWHLFVIKLDDDYSYLRDDLYLFLRNKKIFCQIHYIPIPFHPYYRKLGFDPHKYQNTMLYFKACLSLPIYPDLKLEQVDEIIQLIKLFFNEQK